ncbi:MAG TPA: DNA polymerase Y family protein [Puia sp.]|jgi:protein ImuB
MTKRFLYCWFPHLTTDWLILCNPKLAGEALVVTAHQHGRIIVTAASQVAQAKGIRNNMSVADAMLIEPTIRVAKEKPGRAEKLLQNLALWCLRYTPIAAVDGQDGLILDITGCAHLWGGEERYFREIILKLRSKGFDVRGAIADTIGAAWANARYGRVHPILKPGEQQNTILSFSPAALRLNPITLVRLRNLGLRRISDIARIQRSALRRRFGDEMILRLDQAFGQVEELITPVVPVEIFEERLPCLDPIRTAGGIEIALTRLLETLCLRLQKNGKGLREAIFKGYRLDGKVEQISVGTSRASAHVPHLLRLLAEKIPTMEPDLGFEVFSLTAPKVEDAASGQEALWETARGLEHSGLPDLVDRINNIVPEKDAVKRFLPDAHHWPERSVRLAVSIREKSDIPWPDSADMPAVMLKKPEPIEVTAPIPDYPPMHFRYRGKLHTITKADGPERIANEWWLDNVQYRDYYAVEESNGARYWLFRSGDYTGTPTRQWFIHGFFA